MMRFRIAAVFPVLGLLSSPSAETRAAPPAGVPPVVTAHDFAFTDIDGGAMPLSAHAGKVLLVVNTASRCGYTPQYSGLQELWRNYRRDGLVVVGVPSNDFGGQEPGANTAIKQFCAVNFGVDFPLAAKETVRGDSAHPFYRWAGKQAGLLGSPKWNFHKYLIGRDGRFIDWFATHTKPMSDKVRAAVETALAQSAAGPKPGGAPGAPAGE